MSTSLIPCNATIWKHLGPYEAAIYERIRFLGAGKTWEQSAVEIAEQLHIPIRSIGRATKRLVDAGLVEKKRGQNTTFWSLRVYPFELEKHFGNGQIGNSETDLGMAKMATPNGQNGRSEANPTILYKEKDKRKKSIGADAPSFPNQEVDKTAASKTASTASPKPTSKTTSSRTTSAKKPKPVLIEPNSVVLDPWMDPQIWESFRVHREELYQVKNKFPLTANAAKTLMDTMRRYSEQFSTEAVHAAMQDSIISGHPSIYLQQVQKAHRTKTREEQQKEAFKQFMSSGKQTTKVINPDQNFPETSETTEEPLTNWERWLGPIN